jgi:hypothetical protein
MVYLAGMVVGIGGNVLILSILDAPDRLAAVAANSTLLAIGAVLWLTAVVGDAAHGMLMLPVLKPHGERIAFGYFGARLLDAAFIAVMALLILFQIPLAGEYLKAEVTGASSLQALSAVFNQAQLYAYHFGMITVGFAGVMLCYVFHRAHLLPRLLSVWGLVGYATFLCGSVLAVVGFDSGLLHTIPGGLWELFIGVWLIARGFNSPAVASGTPATLPLPAHPAAAMAS